MAETTTTSSEMSKEKNITPPRPKSGEAQILIKLANNLSESYQMVKERQKRFYELNMKENRRSKKQTAKCDEDDGEGEWQEVTNKLKRKKKMSTSLASVSDAVNQEKRTRIEGMQLNCRGRLLLTQSLSEGNTGASRVAKSNSTQPQTVEIIGPIVRGATPPPRLKRKLQENVLTIQKLNALGEQLRLEINDLKSNLINERNAVRVLRAQNESETRKSKNEVKKLQNIIELMKKNNAQLSGSNGRKPTELNAEATSTLSSANHEIQRLTNELQALKEAYKALEEKKMINGDAERRKAADVREMKDGYEIRLTQLSKSAKIEISRLLEEIKSKDRNIGQLKKELQVLQTRIQKEQNKSRNATTSQQAMKQTTNKPKKIKKKSFNETSTKENEKIPKDVENKETEQENIIKDTISKVQDTKEMKNLKDLELLNNMKNLQNSVTINLVKPTVKVNSNSRLQSSKLKTLVNIFENENQKIRISKNELSKNDNSRSKSQFITNKSSDDPMPNQQKEQDEEEQHQQNSQKEFHSLPHDIKTQFMDTNEAATIKATSNRIIQEQNGIGRTTTEEHNEIKTTTTTEDMNEIMNEHEYRTKDHGSDSDSAVSSAPPSISPQPHPANMQTTDIWQTIRTYTSDIEKLQKDVDALHNENESLNAELELAKEQILENEKTAMEAAKNNTKMNSLLDRIKYLEEQERELLNECNELREQNELLEFRILELEDNNDKWSMPAAQQSTTNAVRNASTITQQQQNVWNCNGMGRNSEMGLDIFEYTNEELSQRIGKMLRELALQDEQKKCLQQVLSLLSQQNNSCGSSSNGSSGPSSFNTSSSSDESNSFELVKTRQSPSVQSTSNSIHPIFEHLSNSLKSPKNITTNSRIVATVPPYNSKQPVHIAPNNTPNDSPRKSRTSSAANSWQSSSLSESGVFVESDFFSDASVEQNASTQTDLVDNEDHNSRRVESKVPVAISTAAVIPPAFIARHQAYLNDPKRLQYYQDRLRVLENKLLVYESSGDLQAKHLADRLQREIQLEKELHELSDRVEFLESENAQLEEEKCEFEEAENDTRLRLQRLEIELEILSQRNVELELSKEALSAKYKDCRSECLILREDLSANETQLRNISEDKSKAKENLEFLHSLLPLLIAYNLVIDRVTQSDEAEKVISIMGNVPVSSSSPSRSERVYGGTDCGCCNKLKDEVNCLQYQLRQCNERYHEAMESADTHWLDLELEYKEREKMACAKEASLKQKISRLENILRADACAANEKIMQMEETEKELKNCLRRIAKEHKDILNEHTNIAHEYECCREEMQQLKDAMKLLNEALEEEKKRNKTLQSELCVMQKVHTDSEKRHAAELKTLQAESCCLRKEFQNCEVSNCELREEVATLEQEIQKLQCQLKCLQSKICELCDEIRTKEEMCERLEAELKRSEGFCLALEMDSSPSKRLKRCEVSDLKTAAKGLGQALNNVKDCDIPIPQINCVARDVRRLAEALLCDNDIQQEEIAPKLTVTNIKVSKRSITCKTPEPVVCVVPCETNGSMRQSITLQNQETPEARMSTSKPIEERLTTESIDPQLITQPTDDQLLPERLSASQQVPFPERLSVSQQPLSERMSISTQPPLIPERLSVSQQEPLPERISLSQQEPLTERLSLSQQRVSFSNIARPSANVMDPQQEDQLKELIKEQELYEKPPPPIDQSENPPITSQIPQNMNYPSQFRQSLNNCNLDMDNAPVSNEQTLFSACFEMRGDNINTNILLETTSVCQCECEVTETSCLSPTISSDSISAATLCLKPCGEMSKKSSCLVCPEEVFYSANSGSDTENKIECKKEKKTKKKEISSSHSDICAKEKCSLMQVLERMMQVLETMNTRAQQTAKPPSPCSASQKSVADISIISIDASRNMQRRNFQCLNKQTNADSNANESGTCAEKQRIKKPCKSVMPQNKPCIIIYGVKSAQIPCLSVRVGNGQPSIHAIPTADVDICRSTATTVTDIGQKSKDDHTSQYQDEEEYMEGNILMRDEIETINEANIKVISTEECQECYDDFELILDMSGIQIITNCVQTQTEQCYGPFPATGTPDRTEILSEMCALRDELSDICSCSYQELISEMMPKITSSDGDVPCECDCCFCRAERNKGKTPCQCCECCRRDLKALVDTVILDLESMEMTRIQNERSQAGMENSLKYKSSFPVSITEVTELGRSSLYVKWTVHEGFGIGGYEIYVDGYLKNRYFNSRHEAAVVCDIDVSQPHKIALLARPKEKYNKTILGAGDVFIEEEESPLPSNWTPSTYLYEPSKALDYMKCF